MAAPARRWPLALLALLVLTGLAALVAYLVKWRDRKPAVDAAAVLAAHSRGIGLMEQFKPQEAAQAFEEVVRLDPDWTVGRVNLGIALLNTAKDPANPNLDRAIALFDEVLKREPDNRHALYCLGVIAMYRSELEKAHSYFAAVNRLDPSDAFTWYQLAQTTPDGTDSQTARDALAKALSLDPYLNSARYKLAFHPLTPNDERAQLIEAYKALKDSGWEPETRDYRYTEMGPYYEVIGKPDAALGGQPVGPVPLFTADDGFQVSLAAGARWASAKDFGSDPLGEMRRAVRQRFGGAVVLLDYDGDGRIDLFLPAAVTENGRVRDLLLRNEGGGKFTDATAAAGLAGDRPSLGASAADYDNDGRTDLLISTATGPKLFRNAGAGRFEDVTAGAKLDSVTDVCLSATWVDLDQDGDLDLVLARYAATPADALERLRGRAAAARGGVAVFLNAGVAPATPKDKPLAGLSTAFRRADDPPALLPAGAVVQVLCGDLDHDQDMDLLVLADGATAAPILNDRLLRFSTGPAVAPEASAWNGAVALDVRNQGRSDLLLLRNGQPPLLLHPPGAVASGQGWTAGATNSPPLRQAHAVDVDLDGWTDVAGLSEDGRPVLLHNDGSGRLVAEPDAFGPAGSQPTDLLAVAVADLDRSCRNDLLVWSEAQGLRRWRSSDNGHKAVYLLLNGRVSSADSRRTNTDGIGTRVTAQAGPVVAAAEVATRTAGLGQSQIPLQLGIGSADRAAVVRLRWPDGVPQAELDIPACQVSTITETYRKDISCPVLFTWDGQKYAYVTDCLGAGSMGELAADGKTRPPRPDESVLIEPGRLVPRDGLFDLKLAEPMDEILYLDGLQLVAVDHPADWLVVPDERFVLTGPPPSQELVAFRERVSPVRATDHRGRDVTERLRHRDGRYVDDFELRSWLGFAEEHWVELDFGDAWSRLARQGGRLFLVLSGGTDYAYPESLFAAEQAGVAAVLPMLERLGPDGRWEPWGDLGFPAGLPRTMTREITGLPPGRIRLRTNQRVYWDQALLARLEEVIGATPGGQARIRELHLKDATLAAAGFQREVRRPGSPFVEYDDGRRERVEVTRWQGRLTGFGRVTELLRQADDRFVVCGPGEEVTARFDARGLPATPDGWARSFVLRLSGYCKDSAPFTATAGRVGPLPFRAMPNYPYPAGLPHPAPDQSRWHTRPADSR